MGKNLLELSISKAKLEYDEDMSKVNQALAYATESYNKIYNEFKANVDNIKSDPYLNKQGKDAKLKENGIEYMEKAKEKAKKHIKSIISEIDIAQSNIAKRQMKRESMPKSTSAQLMFMISMLDRIKSTEDINILDYLYDYACDESNFGEEVVALLYIKADDVHKKAMKEQGTSTQYNIPQLERMLNKIKEYNHDYEKDIIDLKNRINYYDSMGHFPMVNGSVNIIDTFRHISNPYFNK